MEVSVFRNKWYFRLIKVIYIITFTFSIIGYPVAIFMETKPYNTYDQDKSSITCIEPSKTYPASNFDLWTETIFSWKETEIKDFCMGSAVFYLRNVTSTDTIAELGEFNSLKGWYSGDYKFNIEYRQEGKGIYAVGYSVLAALGVFITLEIIKRTIFYIITGKFLHID